jgi:hypothetical protein
MSQELSSDVMHKLYFYFTIETCHFYILDRTDVGYQVGYL